MFSFHDEDLGFCYKLAITVLTTTDKLVYLHLRLMLWQIQGKVGKCLDMWVRQGMIGLSKLPYASQVVTICKKKKKKNKQTNKKQTKKKTKWQKCWNMNMHQLLEIKFDSSWECFSFQCINEALQAIHNCQWFTSFVWCKGTYRCPWRRHISKGLLLELDPLTYTTSLVSHLNYWMLGLVSTASWRCVYMTNNSLWFCFT